MSAKNGKEASIDSSTCRRKNTYFFPGHEGSLVNQHLLHDDLPLRKAKGKAKAKPKAKAATKGTTPKDKLDEKARFFALRCSRHFHGKFKEL